MIVVLVVLLSVLPFVLLSLLEELSGGLGAKAAGK
jgi:hypothetical protein